MSNDKRFIIDCYGIIDTYKDDLTGRCEDDRLSWRELCEILNELYENVDTDIQKLLFKNKELEKENEKLKECLMEIHKISGQDGVA